MIKIVFTDEDGDYDTFMVTEQESPLEILIHKKLNPDTKLVYLNGSPVSNERIARPIKTPGVVFMTVKNKVATRF